MRLRSQSNQATASACAVNNIHLVKGAIGKEGASVFQFNGQPTAQVSLEESMRPRTRTARRQVLTGSCSRGARLTLSLPGFQNLSLIHI